jgi:hypothetical protein
LLGPHRPHDRRQRLTSRSASSRSWTGDGRQLPRSPCADARLFPQGLCRRGSVVQLPMPGIKHPSPHQQRILAPLPSLALRTSAVLSLPVHRVIQPVNRPVYQKLHRQQQRDRRPPRDEHRLPLQSRGRRDVRSQRPRSIRPGLLGADQRQPPSGLARSQPRSGRCRTGFEDLLTALRVDLGRAAMGTPASDTEPGIRRPPG